MPPQRRSASQIRKEFSLGRGPYQRSHTLPAAIQPHVALVCPFNGLHPRKYTFSTSLLTHSGQSTNNRRSGAGQGEQMKIYKESYDKLNEIAKSAFENRQTIEQLTNLVTQKLQQNCDKLIFLIIRFFINQARASTDSFGIILVKHTSINSTSLVLVAGLH